MIDQMVIAFLAAGHVLLEGVPGVGKTLTVLAMARTFGGRFARIQFTPDLMPSDVVGHAIFDSASGRFRIRQGPAFTNLLLADEINRAPAKTQAALLEVMQEQQITIEGKSFPLAPPFMAIATQNPVELEGTYPLPEAELDRFLLKVRVDFPGEKDEIDLVAAATLGRVGDALDVSGVEPVADAEAVVSLQRFVAGLTVDRRVAEYAVRIVRATRAAPGIAMGASPRGAIALVRAARAAALVAGRDFVTPDDVKRMALPALRHRITIAPDLDIEGRPVDSVLKAVVDAVEAPRA
ncbi:MAG: AAA family ATPase [Acidobacteria bacterium]|nr:AAA family ATPase [Acidobacteriota bacterium]